MSAWNNTSGMLIVAIECIFAVMFCKLSIFFSFEQGAGTCSGAVWAQSLDCAMNIRMDLALFGRCCTNCVFLRECESSLCLVSSALYLLS